MSNPSPHEAKSHRPGLTVSTGDDGSCYRSHPWRDACAELGITPKRTRPYRTSDNGNIERFHRTLGDGWAYARFYNSTEQRNTALPDWLHFYNHNRVRSRSEPRHPSAD